MRDFMSDPLTDDFEHDVGSGPFAGVSSRGSVNYLIRNTQQQLVALSGQADFKASILITASSVVLTVGLSQSRDSRFEAAFAALAVFLLVSLLSAILCVLPSFRGRKAPLAPDHRLNLLFFGEYTQIEEDEFVDRLSDMSRADDALYEAQARDLYRQGLYLVKHKYRFLRFAYVMFLFGFVAATITSAITWATGN